MRRLKIPFDFSDFLAVVGMGLVAVGLWMIYPPAALIALGFACGYLAVNLPDKERR